eukprot:Nitzschia sp. Nitz4//NODE_542_length_12750_cov_80.145333//4741//6285//NITZ4_additional_000082-RA//-1//CDS//3329531976//1219//frame0
MKNRNNLWRIGVIIVALSSFAWIHVFYFQKWSTETRDSLRPSEVQTLSFPNITIANQVISQNSIPEQSPSPSTASSPCHTYCPHGFYQNRVVYQYSQAPAGLGDRLFVFGTLANLAASLCAHVVVPKPSRALTKGHNHDKPTHPNFSWKDFVQYTLQQDPSIELISENSKHTGSERFQLKFTTDSVQQIEEHWKKARNYVYANATTGSTTTSQVPSPTLTGFQWKIDINFFTFLGPLNTLMNNEEVQQQNNQRQLLVLQPEEQEESVAVIPKNPFPNLNRESVGPRCHYVKESITSELVQLAKDILDPPFQLLRGWKESNFSNPKVSYYMEHLQHVQQASDSHWMIGLHVRRGDLASHCDTSLEKLLSYLECSIVDHLPRNKNNNSISPNTPASSSNKNNATIFFFSDENDEEYRTSLAHSVQRNLQLGFVDLDLFVRGALRSMDAEKMPAWKRANNYFSFRVLQAVAAELQLDLSLEKRRKVSCEECSSAFATILHSNQELRPMNDGRHAVTR